jgi:hypothetical protein
MKLRDVFKRTGLLEEVNAEKTNHVFIPRRHNAG